jgi:hypothetical protein
MPQIKKTFFVLSRSYFISLHQFDKLFLNSFFLIMVFPHYEDNLDANAGYSEYKSLHLIIYKFKN